MNLTVGRSSVEADNDVLPHNPTQVSASSDLSSHLERISLADDGGGCVPIWAGGEAFFAHPAVLAGCSPFLKDQLLDKMIDGGISVALPGIEPGTFRVLLRFMYAGTLPGEKEKEELTTEWLHRLIAAADTLRMDGLKATCAQKLWERVSTDNVAAMLCCAEAHSCPELKARCIDFLVAKKGNITSAAFTEGYLLMIRSFPWLIDELRHEWVLRHESFGNSILFFFSVVFSF